MQSHPSIIVLIYGVLVIGGGIIGYLKARSAMSVVAGTISGLILLLSAWAIHGHKTWGHPLSLAMTGILLVLFAIRFAKAKPRAFMPSGMMAVLSLVALILMANPGHGH